jgi:aspartate racemase
MFLEVIRELAAAGADCAILGCTEIPLIINEDNSPLPVLDSTRLLATYAVREALSGQRPGCSGGWVVIDQAIHAEGAV